MALIHSLRIWIATLCLTLLLYFKAGILVGNLIGEEFFGGKVGTGNAAEFHEKIVNTMKAEEIKENLRYFASKPHSAGHPRNDELVNEIRRRFVSYGFDAQLFTYNVLLSYPRTDKFNYAYIIDDVGQQIFRSKGIEDCLFESEICSDALPPFNAYGPAGLAMGDIVYVNYGRFEDFEELSAVHNISITGKIVLARYGKIFRADKVVNAADRGAVGVLLYSDPFDVAPVSDEQVFPHGRWLSRDGVQRGSVGSFVSDPLTPGYPAKPWAYRETIENVKGLPKIPVQPISATDAMAYLSRFTGRPVPSSWVGALNVTYRFGPMADPRLKARLEVFNELQMTTITNVIGTIKGIVEPDRYVLLGNHIDAWVYGAADPSSGTAVMLEIARALGEHLKKGWRPRRTIKFCGWDGEEAAQIGSSEWVEEFANELRDRAVAYINLDSAVTGNYSITAASSPLLHRLLHEVFGNISDPLDPSMTVLSRSVSATPSLIYPASVDIEGLGSGSDFVAFYQTVGVPSVDFNYQQTDLNRKYRISGHPMYHTLHDTIYWMERFVDPDYVCHLAVAKVAAYSLLRIADEKRLPFDVSRYADVISRSAISLKERLLSKGSRMAGFNADILIEAALNFTAAVKAFDMSVQTANLDDPLVLRQVNDELSQLEKGFIYPTGLPGRPSTRHYIIAPSLHNQYVSSMFPAVEDLLYDIEKTKNWDAVKRQMTITTFIIQSVAQKLVSAL